MDAQRWTIVAFVVAVLAWIFPQPVLAKVIGKLRDWYSTRTQNKLRQRIADLEARLERSEKEWTFTPAEWEVFGALARQTDDQASFEMNIYMFLLAFLFLLYPGLIPNFHFKEQKSMYWFLTFATFFLILSNRIVRIYENKRHNQDRQMHSVQGRVELRERIEKLKKKKREPPAQQSVTPQPLRIMVNGKVVSETTFHVLAARYGCQTKFVDVTWTIASRLQNSRISVLVNNELTPQDPCPGTPKILVVQYEFDGKQFTKTVAENDVLSIP
jgi:hypothetical protein